MPTLGAIGPAHFSKFRQACETKLHTSTVDHQPARACPIFTKPTWWNHIAVGNSLDSIGHGRCRIDEIVSGYAVIDEIRGREEAFIASVDFTAVHVK